MVKEIMNNSGTYNPSVYKEDFAMKIIWWNSGAFDIHSQREIQNKWVNEWLKEWMNKWISVPSKLVLSLVFSILPFHFLASYIFPFSSDIKFLI